MLEYRARIMRRDRPARLRQHVVLLAGGHVEDRIEDGDHFFLRYGVTYVHDHDPRALLARPGLAALASLGRASDAGERAQILTEAYRVIAEEARPERRTDLAGVAAVLAAIHLDAATIERAGREAGMPISLDGTVGGRSLEARGEARVVAALLERRFGADDRIGALAVRLVAESADGATGAVDRVLAAARLEELLTGS